MTALVAWHDDPALRRRTIESLWADRDANRLQPGAYRSTWMRGTTYEGCMIGRMVAVVDPSADSVLWPQAMWCDHAAERLGFAPALVRLWEWVFENIDNPYDAATFAIEAVSAVATGIDTRITVAQVLADFLTDPKMGLRTFLPGDILVPCLDMVADLLRNYDPNRANMDRDFAAARALMAEESIRGRFPALGAIFADIIDTVEDRQNPVDVLRGWSRVLFLHGIPHTETVEWLALRVRMRTVSTPGPNSR